MEISSGMVLDGTVKSITNFGAFISLPENKTGLVHISEVAHDYVSDIREHLAEGQAVKVMVIGVENGKINLSIKRTLAAPKRPANPPVQKQEPAPSGQSSFDEMLKRFMADSDSKIASIKQYSEHRTKPRRR